jgi:hypothetical protein
MFNTLQRENGVLSQFKRSLLPANSTTMITARLLLKGSIRLRKLQVTSTKPESLTTSLLVHLTMNSILLLDIIRERPRNIISPRKPRKSHPLLRCMIGMLRGRPIIDQDFYFAVNIRH